MMHVSVGEPLSAGTLARRLGVAPTTLRTWHQRYGLGPSEHRSGQHRRYTSLDIARLTVMAQLTTRGVPAAEAARRARRESTPPVAEHRCGDPTADAEARGLARAARRMDVLALREALTAAVACRGVVRTWQVLAGAALLHIGHARYPEPGKTIARRLLVRTLGEVFAAVPRPPAGTPVPVLLIQSGRGLDIAGSDALAAALAERGVASIHLGAGPDAETVGVAVDRTRPVVVVLWGDDPELRAACAGGPAVVEAGPGLDVTVATILDLVTP
ncbi:MAG TPA: MerR family transcriptional regulator [Actinoplanes sp.]|nr:MerR family transcriptional regulator [Actinoplanes sp.]